MTEQEREVLNDFFSGNDRIAEKLERRNRVLMEYDREQAEQLILAEKRMYWIWFPIGISTAVLAYLILVAK